MSSICRKQRPFCRDFLARLPGRRRSSDFHFFYGYEPSSAGEFAVLSNWYMMPEPFSDCAGNKFPTSEHYMMHAKAKLFNDESTARRILRCASPGDAKALGRQVRGFDERIWAENCLFLVADGCEFKFSQSTHCRNVLLGTGDRILAETAPRDLVWGIGMGEANPQRLDPACWRGENLLGEALMIVRKRLRDRGDGAAPASASASVCHCHCHCEKKG